MLALPLLPSLLSRRAEAAGSTQPPRLVLIAQIHGGYFGSFHGDPTLPNRRALFGAHDVNWGPLSAIAQTSGGTTSISRILSAASTALTPRLLAKMNVLRGIDMVSTSGHTWTAFGNLGNAEGDKDSVCGSGNCYLPPMGIPSVDQLAAWSPTYNQGGVPKLRSLQTGPARNQSWYHAANGTGPVTSVAPDLDPARLFNKVFAGFTYPPPGPTAPPARKPLVDHLLQSYKNLRGSGRLSAADRERLDSHIDGIAELQRRLATQTPPGMSQTGCAVPNVASAPADESVARFQAMNDIISMAFKCGLSRIATLQTTQEQTSFDPGIQPSGSGGWHELCHLADKLTTAPSSILHLNAYQRLFEKVVLDLANKLDSDVEADGKTYLDNTLMVFINSEGVKTHSGLDLPIATFGGAGGAVKTGNFIDYRNRTKPIGGTFAGLYANQFWSTVLGALGIPRSEWEKYGTAGKGYGPLDVVQHVDGSIEGFKLDSSLYLPEVREKSGEALPIFV